MSEQVDSRVTLTKPVIMIFPSIITPKRVKVGGKENGDPIFSAQFVLDPDNPDFNTIRATAAAVAKAKWPGRDLGADFKANLFKMPWTMGDKLIEKQKNKLRAAGKEYDGRSDYMAGKIVLGAKSSQDRPPALAIVGANNQISPNLEGPAIQAHKGLFYFGVYVLAQFNLSAYPGVGANPDGVTAYMNLIVSTGKGKRLSSAGASAAEVFKGYAGFTTADDPTNGMDDEVPF